MQNIDEDVFDRILLNNTFGRCLLGGAVYFAVFVVIVFSDIVPIVPVFQSSTLIIAAVSGVFIAFVYANFAQRQFTLENNTDRQNLKIAVLMILMIGFSPIAIYIYVFYFSDFPSIVTYADVIENARSRLIQLFFINLLIGSILAYPVQILAKYLVALDGLVRQEEKNRQAINIRIRSEARKLYPVLTEYVGLRGEEVLSIIRPLLLPFIDLLCVTARV